MDYTQYDYDTLIATVASKLSEQEGWGDNYDSSTGSMLIQLFADTTDALLYMLERRSQEAFISTAELQTSIFAHASELGYRPRRVVAQTGTLEITLVDGDGNPVNAEADIIIPQYTKVTLSSPTVDYVVTETTTIPAGASSITFPVKEGTWVRTQVSADDAGFVDTKDIVFTNYRAIDEYSLTVDDNGFEYVDVEKASGSDFNYGTLAYAKGTDRVYDVKYAMEGMRIVFGDNTFGKTPDGVITVNYVLSNEIDANIISTGNEFRFEGDEIYDIQNVIPRRAYSYSITNTTPIRGYSAAETTTEIAENAPDYARANSRALDNSDFEFWGVRSAIGDIVDINAYGEEESGSLIYNMNNVNLTYITEDGLPLNTEQEIQFREYMDNFKTITIHLVVQEAEKIQAVLNIEHRKDSRLPVSNEQLYTIIRDAINSYFQLQRGSVGGRLIHSELVKYLQELQFTVNNVAYDVTDFVKVTIQPRYQLPDTYSAYDVRISLDNAYTPLEDDVWTVSIDGTPISVTVLAGETNLELVERMRVAISNATALLTALETTATTEVVRLRAQYVDDSFVVDVSQGDVAPNVTTDQMFKIPSSVIYNRTGNDLVVAGSCKIVDEDGTEVFIDDGTGLLVAQQAGNDIPIDYKNVELSDPYKVDPLKTYYFEFQQDEFQNIHVSDNAVIILSDIATLISDTPLDSKIVLV